MPRPLRIRPGVTVATAWLLLAAAGWVHAQDIKDLFDIDLGGPRVKAPEPKVSAQLSAAGEAVTLSIRVELPEGYNTYSLDPSFSGHTKIQVNDVVGLTPLDEAFSANPPPKMVFDDGFQREIEKHHGTVTWSRRYKLMPGAALESAKIRGHIDYQACKDSCYPLEATFEARLAAAAPPSAVPDLFAPTITLPSTPSVPSEPAPTARIADGPHRDGYLVVPTRTRAGKVAPDPLSLQVEWGPAGDDVVVLALTLRIDDGFRTYALEKLPKQFEVPTTIEITELAGLEPIGAGFQPVEPPYEHVTEVGKSLAHEHSVTWTRAFRKAGGATPGLRGYINYQICEGELQCMPPFTVQFSLGSLQQPDQVAVASMIAASELDRARPIALGEATAEEDASALAQIHFEDETAGNSLGMFLVWAFLGGLILNVMPCVLPVISIKVLSFVHQAGSHPGRIFLLNGAYSLGVLTVFITLATLAVTLKLGWGAQNQSAVYNMAMAGIVFAMGLSLLGVFEIPIPGLMSSSVGGQHHPEGLPGAFFTGILATLLATPCTGPFMATTLFWSVKQPIHITYLVWTVMGLGMASPYLLLGCFPKLVDLLPRPGNWMVTFKQFCGFVLMGTVVWLLNTISGIDSGLVIPTLIILVGLSLMLWMVGNMYNLSSTSARRWSIRFLSLVLGGPVIALGVIWTQQQLAVSEAIAGPSPSAETPVVAEAGHKLPWQPFSTAKLEELVKAGEPVLIDFTADWCGICKLNEYRALNTEETANFVKQHGFTTLIADFTAKSPDIRKVLNQFGQDSVPLTVIIPAGQPKKTKVLRASFSQGELLEKLEEAAADSAAEKTAATGNKTASMQR
jgi:suppressor for copper-sensitivity B